MFRGYRLWKSISDLSRVKNLKVSYYQLKAIGFANWGLITAYCEKLPDLSKASPDNLTHKECIKQACMISANSASTLLTVTTEAILDVCGKYKNSLYRILNLYEELLLTQGEKLDVWDTVIEFRQECDEMKSALADMNSYMVSVEKVVNSTTEAAFLAGSEYLCTVLCERLYSAQNEITKNMSEVKKLEDDFLKLEKEVAKTIKKKDE